MIQYELEFIGGNFYDISDLPKKDEYILKYFSSKEWHLVFLVYCIKMKGLCDQVGFPKFYKNFVNHTGIWVEEKTFRRTYNKFLLFHQYMDQKRKEGDFKTLSNIKAGKFILERLGNLDAKVE